MRIPFLHPKRIYLDAASITPISDTVRRTMDAVSRIFYNPSSIHRDGVTAQQICNTARTSVAKHFGAHEDEIIFTASGTESCALAIIGTVHGARDISAKPHVIVSAIEHQAVQDTVQRLERDNLISLTKLPVDQCGRISHDELAAQIRPETVLISCMMTNNETGSMMDIKTIGNMVRKIRGAHRYPLFHTDASQAVLYEDLAVYKLHTDVLTIDGIKCYGPRGIGVLYKRRGVKIVPLFGGGGQEHGFRSGTENVPAIAGLAAALSDAHDRRAHERVRLADIRAYARDKIKTVVPHCIEHRGEGVWQSPHILNICFPGADAEYVTLSLDARGFSVSYASACLSTHGDASSYVISALGHDACARSSIRFSFGRETTKKDIDRLLRAMQELVHRGVIPLS